MSVNSFSTNTTNGLTPSQILTAYGINLIQPINGKPLGYGIKIAIINCYHYSNLQSDLNVYCSKYSLSPICLNIINQAGSVKNNNWAIEANLATQIINTICPGATVYVIEAKSTTLNDIKTAITTAVNLGVNIISIPFGTLEYSTQSSLEYLFLKTGITFISASGDSNNVNYPSSSSNVIAIGSTILTLNNDNTRNTEVISNTSGSGSSIYAPKPSYQNSVNSTNHRNVPDLSLMGQNGFLVYSSLNGGYISINGTSVSANLFTGIVCIANYMRKSQNRPMLNSISTSSLCLQTYLYQTIYPNSSLNCLYDIGDSSYDIISGLGSVKANNLCTQLLSL